MKKLLFLMMIIITSLGVRAQSLYLVNLSPCDAYVTVMASSSPSYPGTCTIASSLVTVPAGGSISFTGTSAYLAFQGAYPWTGNPPLAPGETVTWDAFSFQFGTCACGSGGGSVASGVGICGVANGTFFNNMCRTVNYVALGGGNVQLFIL